MSIQLGYCIEKQYTNNITFKHCSKRTGWHMQGGGGGHLKTECANAKTPKQKPQKRKLLPGVKKEEIGESNCRERQNSSNAI